MGVEPTTFCLRSKCSTTKLQKHALVGIFGIRNYMSVSVQVVDRVGTLQSLAIRRRCAVCFLLGRYAQRCTIVAAAAAVAGTDAAATFVGTLQLSRRFIRDTTPYSIATRSKLATVNVMSHRGWCSSSSGVRVGCSVTAFQIGRVAISRHCSLTSLLNSRAKIVVAIDC